MTEYLFTNTDLMIYTLCTVLFGLCVGVIVTTIAWERIISPTPKRDARGRFVSHSVKG